MGCSGSKAVEVNAAQSVANQVPNSLTKPKIAVSNGTIETKALNTMTKAVAVANPLEELTANVADDVAETGETTIVAEAEKIEEIKITEAETTEISASVEVTQENVPTTEVKPATPEPQQEETKTTVVESEANAVTTEVEVITTQEEQAVSDTVPEQEAEPQQEAVKETQNKADGEE